MDTIATWTMSAASWLIMDDEPLPLLGVSAADAKSSLLAGLFDEEEGDKSPSAAKIRRFGGLRIPAGLSDAPFLNFPLLDSASTGRYRESGSSVRGCR